jgi:membrane-bound ClpP family serine protease
MNKNIPRIAGLVLILAGLSSFFLNPERPPTALIGPFVGVILLFASIGLNGERNKSFWVSVIVSLLFGLMTANMAFKSYGMEDSAKKERRIIIFWTMSLTTLVNGGYILATNRKQSSDQK